MSSTGTPAPDQITDGILDILAEARGFVTLADIRAEWDTVGASRDAVDQALVILHTDRRIVLIPEANQKTLTDAQRAAALYLGGEYRHVACLPQYDR